MNHSDQSSSPDDRDDREHGLPVTGMIAGDRLTATIVVDACDVSSGRFTLSISDLRKRGDGDALVQAPGPAITTDDRLHMLFEQSRSLGAIRAAVVHPCDAPSLSGALAARAAGMLDPVLIAPAAKLAAVAAAAHLDLSGLHIVDVPHSHAAAEKAAAMAASGDVAALVKGSLHTDELMTAVIATPGLRTARRMSHCFVMQIPSYPRPFIITDAAINMTPDLDIKADIVRNSIRLAHAIGIARPRVAILAAVETVNPRMPATLDAAALCKMADRGQITGAILDGPLAFDNAVSAAAADIKGIVSDVAGRADILIVPDLESGNMLVKQLEYLGGAASAGIVVGARVPIALTSRADSHAARMASCALALLLAQHYRNVPI